MERNGTQVLPCCLLTPPRVASSSLLLRVAYIHTSYLHQGKSGGVYGGPGHYHIRGYCQGAGVLISCSSRSPE
jgi:hypothetical protein